MMTMLKTRGIDLDSTKSEGAMSPQTFYRCWKRIRETRRLSFTDLCCRFEEEERNHPGFMWISLSQHPHLVRKFEGSEWLFKRVFQLCSIYPEMALNLKSFHFQCLKRSMGHELDSKQRLGNMLLDVYPVLQLERIKMTEKFPDPPYQKKYSEEEWLILYRGDNPQHFFPSAKEETPELFWMGLSYRSSYFELDEDKVFDIGKLPATIANEHIKKLQTIRECLPTNSDETPQDTSKQLGVSDRPLVTLPLNQCPYRKWRQAIRLNEEMKAFSPYHALEVVESLLVELN